MSTQRKDYGNPNETPRPKTYYLRTCPTGGFERGVNVQGSHLANTPLRSPRLMRSRYGNDV